MADVTGVWQPGPTVRPDTARLERFIEILRQAGDDELASVMDSEEIRANAGLMQLPRAAWQIAETFDDESLVQLVRFFTLAEMQLDGWDAGKRSPVIYLVRILKARDAFDEELRRWIKSNTDNRYLPYGSAL